MNRMSQIALCCLALVSTHSAHAAEPVDYSLDLHLSFGYSSVADKSMQEVVRLSPDFRVEFSPRTKLVTEARVRVDFADQLEPGEADVSTYSNLSRPALINDLGTAEIRDAYVEHALGNGILRFGKQQIVWGKLDGIKVLDVLNPQNLREFILDDFGESRISLWSAYLDATLAGLRTELAIIPDNSGHAIPVDGGWFELTAPRYRYGADPGDPMPRIITRRESIGVDTSAYALRLSRYFGAVELGAIAYSGLDHEPLGRLIDVDGAATVERFYERRDIYGMSAETSFASFALRAEIAVQPDREFNTRTPALLSTMPLDQLRAGFGVDVDGPWNTFINLQFVHDDIRDAPASLVRPDQDRIITVFLKRSFNYDSVAMTARWYRSLELGDEMFSLALAFAIGDSTKLQFAADGFSGQPSGIFGQFADRDRLTVSLTHLF